MLNKTIGNYGEYLAEKYLIKQNYKIIYKNYYCKLGEIDIIGINENFLCFIEVKSRYNLNYGYPRESVTVKKQRKIRTIAKYYLMQKKMHNYDIRFDIVEILLNYSNDKNEIFLLKNAF